MSCSLQSSRKFPSDRERFMKLRHGFNMEAAHGAQSKNTAHRDVVVFIELDATRVALVDHGVHVECS
jgi:hypothetical protein